MEKEEKKKIKNNIIDIENNIIKQIYEEEKINKLLYQFSFNKPKSILDIFIKEKFKEEKIFNDNIYKIRRDKIFKDKYEKYKTEFNLLDEEKKKKYKLIFEKENIVFSKNIEIIRKYIFKGIDGNIKLKKTAYQLFLSDEIIHGLEEGYKVDIIFKNAPFKWKNLDIVLKKNIILKKKRMIVF